jgi:hypothetical protein
MVNNEYKNNFAVFILTHGRPDNVITYRTIKKANYTGKIYIIIDNEDETAPRYYDNFGDQVIMFDKSEIAKTFDEADNFDDRRAIVYARNACFNIAKELGIEYFIQLDDDYTEFRYSEDKKGIYEATKQIKDLNKTFKTLLDFYINTTIHSIAFSQGGDFIGGENSKVFKEKFTRKCMNSFICSTKRPFQFVGRINEDVNTYTYKGSIGHLFFTTSMARLEQKTTQSNIGGMTEIYLNAGTYIKSFYTVIFMPSSVTIQLMGNSNKRLHHQVKWNNTVPMIIREEHKRS